METRHPYSIGTALAVLAAWAGFALLIGTESGLRWLLTHVPAAPPGYIPGMILGVAGVLAVLALWRR